ncbi:helix-turn-helix domain-containing protein [Kibdelosporangium aridum]|uniref:Helix-turn-helix domain-containing protein n=1 Tax=Kibdelosporangium aridum TaxID=2030 RepID=A0A1W2EY06_KIBAR|nr:helix-turn-helix transcriptional regulator [Kibdelosporangium aridum]SMD14561.1 Helix-turn-helix domain-containing protein [Kibdelosporangium aridum]
MAGQTPPPNYYGRQLLRQLKSLREQTGMTQAEAGDRARIEFKKLSRIERKQLPSYHELVMLLDVYGVVSCDFAPYVSLWELARARGWWAAYGLKDERYVRMEDEAAAKYEFQLGYVPALLQTEQYARAVFTHSPEPRSDKAIESLVKVRMRQQERLVSDTPLQLHALLYEPVLRQGVDRTQLLRLVELAELPNVTLQIVPQTDEVHAGLSGSLILLSFADQSEPDIAFTETLLGLSESQEAGTVSKVKCALDQLARMAHSPQQTMALLQEMLGAVL